MAKPSRPAKAARPHSESSAATAPGPSGHGNGSSEEPEAWWWWPAAAAPLPPPRPLPPATTNGAQGSRPAPLALRRGATSRRKASDASATEGRSLGACAQRRVQRDTSGAGASRAQLATAAATGRGGLRLRTRLRTGLRTGLRERLSAASSCGERGGLLRVAKELVGRFPLETRRTT